MAGENKRIRRDLPVIMFTGYSDQISPADAEKIGITEFLLKPVSKSDLDRTIRNVMDGICRQQG